MHFSHCHCFVKSSFKINRRPTCVYKALLYAICLYNHLVVSSSLTTPLATTSVFTATMILLFRKCCWSTVIIRIIFMVFPFSLRYSASYLWDSSKLSCQSISCPILLLSIIQSVVYLSLFKLTLAIENCICLQFDYYKESYSRCPGFCHEHELSFLWDECARMWLRRCMDSVYLLLLL